MKQYKTLEEWGKYLIPKEKQALRRQYLETPVTHFSADEVFDIIVNNSGGLTDGNQIRCIIGRVYGVELE